MAPIWEALVRRGNDMKLRYFRCRHELLAVSLASGSYKATGRSSQIVFLPTSLGVQNGSMALDTAMQERTPMTVLSPDTLTYGEDPTSDPGPEWPSLLVDLVGPARNAEAVVKWSKRARTPSELVHELRRASFIAESGPPGPTLLEIPFDLLVGEGHRDMPRGNIGDQFGPPTAWPRDILSAIAANPQGSIAVDRWPTTQGGSLMLEVVDKGSATESHPVPLLFVHGAWHASWCWDEHFLDFFADKGYRAVALSLRGHGKAQHQSPCRDVRSLTSLTMWAQLPTAFRRGRW